mmetsp:Transcript_20952/g.45839  ORF Transcript_20952/g.45839 Transcript_20952/m.45839 type:complete len:286 (+) Transcript_20952:905-1762(+)
MALVCQQLDWIAHLAICEQPHAPSLGPAAPLLQLQAPSRGAPWRLGPLGVKHEAGHDAHGHQLLEQQLARVRHHHLHDVGLVLVDLAAELLLLEVGHRKEAAALAHVHPVRVTDVKEPLLEEGGRAVADDAVTLHLSEPQATVSCSSLHRLPCQDLQGPSCSRVDLEVHHVLEALVVGGVEEDLSLKLAACVPVVHDLPASALVAQLVQRLRDVLHCHVREGGGVTLIAHQSSNLGHERLHQVPDGHARRNGVWVDNQVGHDALRGERHVLLRVGDAHSSLLPVP